MRLAGYDPMIESLPCSSSKVTTFGVWCSIAMVSMADDAATVLDLFGGGGGAGFAADDDTDLSLSMRGWNET